MLDLSKFTQPQKVIVPILNNSFIYNRKSYQIKSDDGWYLVEIVNNCATILEETIPYNIVKKVLGYTYHNQIIFQNFDVARRKWNFSTSAPLYFNKSSSFEAIEAVVWEDNRIYWLGTNYNDFKALELKDALDNDEDISTKKGITPELRTLFLFHSLEKEQQKQLLKAQQEKEEQERMMATIPGRLKYSFERAGAEVLNYELSGDNIIVDWGIPGASHQYNSVINSKTWMVVEAGYCMSNDDRRHNITSLIKTAEDYEERGLTFLTRDY